MSKGCRYLSSTTSTVSFKWISKSQRVSSSSFVIVSDSTRMVSDRRERPPKIAHLKEISSSVGRLIP